MSKIVLFLLLLFPCLVEAESSLVGKSAEESYAGKVVRIEIGKKDLVNGQAFKFWERTLDRVVEEKAKALIFDLNTPGGLAFPTKELMSKIASLEVPTISYINPEAMSAGALIAVSTDEIYMSPGALVGSAALVSGSGMKIEDTMRAKIESFFDAHVRYIVEKKGHRYDVIEAMMMVRDEDRQIGQHLVKKGELLALNSQEAIAPTNDGTLFAKAEVKSLDELLALKDFKKADLVTATPTGFEKFAWWVASISAILILIGFGGGYFELQTPGFGVGGVVSLLAFGLFFFGNYVAGNMAGYELAAIFVLGLILIAVEIFVIPGFGVAGITGLALLLGSLGFAMVDRGLFNDWQLTGSGMMDALAKPAMHLTFGILGSLGLLFLMMRYLPDSPLFKRILLNESLAAGTGMAQIDQGQGHVGQIATATTDLRPAGKIELSGEVLDASVEGGFVSRGEAVEVVKEDGMGIVVKRREV